MSDFTDALVFLLVVGLRLFVPLAIPRFPLPAIVAALLIDGVDQTIFQTFTNLDLEGYQSYDKAMDVYYLAIAYISTLRNWTNLTGYETARFLWYYRLVGATLFELIGWRALLLIFPNTFEYFFIWYEGMRLRWNPRRFTRNLILGGAAVIWIVIKLPQEYWIHVAQMDATEFIKEEILGMPLTATWREAIAENLWVFPALLVIGALAAGGVLVARRRLPAGDWKPSFDADANVPPEDRVVAPARVTLSVSEGLLEKVMLVGLLCVIFAKMLPTVDTSSIFVFSAVAVVVVVNAFVSHWFAMRGTEWRSLGIEFATMAAINLAVGSVYLWLLRGQDNYTLGTPLFFTLLLTLIVVLYDRYRPIHDARFGKLRSAEPEAPAELRPAS